MVKELKCFKKSINKNHIFSFIIFYCYLMENSKQIVTEGSVDKIQEHIKESICEAATKVLGKTTLKAKQWFNKICEEAVQRRKPARQES